MSYNLLYIAYNITTPQFLNSILLYLLFIIIYTDNVVIKRLQKLKVKKKIAELAPLLIGKNGFCH